jgi:hypothetical protein
MILTPENCTLKGNDLEISFLPHLNIKIKFSISENRVLKWHRRENRQWLDFSDEDPGIPLLYLNEQNNPVITNFFSQIPETILMNIRPLLPFQMTILQYVLDHENAEKMLFSNRLLLWLLVSETQFNKHRKCLRSELLKLKQTELLQLLVGNSSRSALRFISKLSQAKFTSDDLVIIKKTLKNQDLIDFFKHKKQVCSLHLKVCENYGFLLKMGFIDDFFNIAEQTECHYLIETFHLENIIQATIQLGINNNITNARDIIRNCKSINAFNQISDSWYRKYILKRHVIQNPKNIYYPKPPVPGNGDIIPILCQEQLIQESNVMNHCVKKYHDIILKGEKYFYKMIYPQRCTIAIEISEKGKRITLADVRVQNNQLPFKRTTKIINNYFRFALRSSLL